MNVTVETQCSRCLKKEEERVSLEKAQEMENTDKERESAQDDLCKQLETLLNGMEQLAPDLVLIQRLPEGVKVRMLNELCHQPDAKRNRGCQNRVDYLMKEIFLENPKPAAKPKGKGKDKGKSKGPGTGEKAGPGEGGKD